MEFADVQLVSPDGRHLISDPLNFKVPKGKNIMLTGPNGCGKSSLCAPPPPLLWQPTLPSHSLGLQTPFSHPSPRALAVSLT